MKNIYINVSIFYFCILTQLLKILFYKIVTTKLLPYKGKTKFFSKKIPSMSFNISSSFDFIYKLYK